MAVVANRHHRALSAATRDRSRRRRLIHGALLEVTAAASAAAVKFDAQSGESSIAKVVRPLD